MRLTMYFECEECSFESNSQKSADKHEHETGHSIEVTIDYEEKE